MSFVDPVTGGRVVAHRGGTTMANQIIHAEVTGKNAPALQRFFGDLFDWTLNTDLPGGYGIAEKAGGGIDSGWLRRLGDVLRPRARHRRDARPRDRARRLGRHAALQPRARDVARA